MTPLWKATVVFAAARPEQVERISYALFEAPNRWAAAQNVARWAAQYRYGAYGDTSGVHSATRSTPTVFRANVGRRPRSDVGRLEGTSIVIELTPIWEE